MKINLQDISLNEFTWRRPNSEIFSTIDRLFYSKTLKLKTSGVNWALSMSDHAAVVTSFNLSQQCKVNGTKIPRLDPSLFKDVTYKTRIKEELRLLLNQVPAGWNPHLRLEYLKMCIRTVTEKIQAERKMNERSEEELLNVELDLAVKALAREEVRDGADLIDHIEDLRSQKELFVEKKGQRLAEKLGTKWYNEGEKSTRYFLRILNRASPDNFKELKLLDGTISTDPATIEKEIVEFYKNLYENYDKTHLQLNADDEFFNEIISVDATNQSEISAPISREELLKVLSTCKDSAPGPDGIPYSIWRELWEEAGDILLEAWQHSLRTGNLPPSHKISFLKLIPKLGKDLKLLTNWRPITLSNCDHKIFTKLYANRICDRISGSIGENQTAYLKGRLINDNVRSLLANIKIVNQEENINAAIISLDAKKAFDSVEHSYIEKCLRKYGLNSFVPIFRMLYADLKSDILINGKVAPGYMIKRGVKQGDALSCVLFIMCMEPLLRNIEKNALIEPIYSQELNSNLPKVYAYADDVNCVTQNNLISIQKIFDEYARLTKLSGLQLNAEKTEILNLCSNNVPINDPALRIRYLDDDHRLKPSPVIKVNGIYLCQNEEHMRKTNVEAVAKKINANLKKWSQRCLSVLGKVLITKTFGISQLIFLCQSMCLYPSDVKLFNSILYKFIWNRNFQAAKAPERIKREIMNKPIKFGGLGMLDIVELDKSLKIKALGRLEGTRHPMLNLIKSTLDLSSFFFPKVEKKIEDIISRGIELLAEDRQALWGEARLYSNRIFVKSLKELRLVDVVSRNGRNSLAYFNIRLLGKIKLSDLNVQEIRSLRPFVNSNLIRAALESSELNPGDPLLPSPFLYFNGSTLTSLSKLTSKEIRTVREDKDPLCIYKFGPILTVKEAHNWAHCLTKITNTRHKDLLLRLAHGELYYRERLHRHRLIDNPLCLRCGQVETLEHKYVNCEYIRMIWERVDGITRDLSESHLNLNINEKVLCCKNPNNLLLTIHAELILRIRSLKADQTYLIHPKVFVRKAIEHLLKRELKEQVREDLRTLLDH